MRAEIRKALEDARHALVVSHNLNATDKELNAETFSKLEELTWKINNDKEIKLIDEALALDDFDPVADIEEFHTKFNLVYRGKPRVLPPSLLLFRRRFAQEELDEYDLDAQRAQNALGMPRLIPDPSAFTRYLSGMLDSLVDLVYVALGTAYLHGFNFREAWKRVHAANMKKVRAKSSEQSTRHSSFDVVKPKGWTAPTHTDLVEDHAHRDSVARS